MEGGLNSVLAKGADEDEATENVLVASESMGGFDPQRFGKWAAMELADGSVTLPGIATSVLFMGKTYGSGINPLPGA